MPDRVHDAQWGTDSDTPGYPGPFYRLCEDAGCRYLRAADPPRVHYHYIGPDRADSDC